MVVKLAVSSLYADGFSSSKARGREESIAADCPRRQKMRQVSLPALVEDDSEVEETFEQEPRPCILRADHLRRQKSLSPPRRARLLRHMVLPSLSEDEEP